MSEAQNSNNAHLDRWLLDQWAQRLSHSLETMTGETPIVETAPVTVSPPGSQSDILWWKQPLSLGDGALVWVGAQQEAWSSIGGNVLRAAGMDESSQEDQRNSYLEILQQSLSGLANAVTGLVRSEVLCQDGAESADPPSKHLFDCRISFSGAVTVALQICFEDALTEAIVATQQVSANPESQSLAAASSSSSTSVQDIPDTNRTLDLLFDVELPVSISFGRAHLPLKEVLKLTSGSIVELNRGVSDPVEVIVNNCVIARGEVVVVDGKYGVRVSQIVSRRERLRTLN